jgi:hypothetical protein
VRRSWLFLSAVAACGTSLLTGCSASHSAASATCGSASTAAGVPVIIEVAKGNVSCSTALSIETKYTALIKSGDVRGTGGGAPVTVSGWTCQGYSTPQILQTGDASQCHTPTAEILAVLPTPTATPTP